MESVVKKISTETVASVDRSFYLTTLKEQQKWVRSILSSSGNPDEPESLRVFGTMQIMTAQHKTEMALRELTEDLEQRVGEQTEELLTTNGLLKTKNEEMTDSINYAKLIQKALIAKSKEYTRIFSKSFVL
ncbi:MAG: benzoyl-CoA reductase/2-hydroxyglutaryl-CoA dehydratase subunit BcrC/BadD/HgdB [Bacteroidia bacterium]|jgi:benzoyl-CoA reductase/2-hydroxyglutaryl-CoA dehydratase subunit BcrC/BadD/HgdB